MKTLADLRAVDVPVPSSAVVAAALIKGYAVARITGVRPLGGVVLLGGWAVAAHQWNKKGPAALAGLTAAYLAAFGLSHPLAKKIGAWPAVITVAAADAALTWAVADRD